MRGVKTLALRMREHTQNAQAVAPPQDWPLLESTVELLESLATWCRRPDVQERLTPELRLRLDAALGKLRRNEN